MKIVEKQEKQSLRLLPVWSSPPNSGLRSHNFLYAKEKWTSLDNRSLIWSLLCHKWQLIPIWYKSQWNTQPGGMRHSTGKGYFNSEIKHSFHVILYEKKKILIQWTCLLNNKHQSLSAWGKLKIKLFWQTKIYCPTVLKGVMKKPKSANTALLYFIIKCLYAKQWIQNSKISLHCGRMGPRLGLLSH